MKDAETKRILLARAARLAYFASICGEVNTVVEGAAYSMLATGRSPARALWRHLRYFVMFECWISLRARIEFKAELFYYKHIRRMSDAEIDAKFISDDEREALEAMRSEGNGQATH